MIKNIAVSLIWQSIPRIWLCLAKGVFYEILIQNNWA
jgi:hypothetical protein